MIRSAVACICLMLSLSHVSPAAAQHLGTRQQWQPELSDDERLHQRVDIEILGRAAGPALKMLSETTGVSLSVAPEDLDTVGERKLTLVSKGLSLRAIMVQLPEALQECHWDIDTSVEGPAYLLHRNAGVDATFEAERRRKLGASRQRAPQEHATVAEAEPPADAALTAEVSLVVPGEAGLPTIQSALAEATGLSVVSDHFESRLPPAVPPQARAGMPLWRLLDSLTQDGDAGRQIVWAKVGQCLVFHHVNWYWLAINEIPEDILRACREKLEEQGHFTIPNLADLALTLQDRGITRGAFPPDLRRAGVQGTVLADVWAFVLHASLTAEQAKKASSEDGLPFAELREDQQMWVLYRARCIPERLPPGQAAQSCLWVTESIEEIRGRRHRKVEVELGFLQAADVAVLLVPLEQAADE